MIAVAVLLLVCINKPHTHTMSSNYDHATRAKVGDKQRTLSACLYAHTSSLYEFHLRSAGALKCLNIQLKEICKGEREQVDSARTITVCKREEGD